MHRDLFVFVIFAVCIALIALQYVIHNFILPPIAFYDEFWLQWITALSTSLQKQGFVWRVDLQSSIKTAKTIVLRVEIYASKLDTVTAMSAE